MDIIEEHKYEVQQLDQLMVPLVSYKLSCKGILKIHITK